MLLVSNVISAFDTAPGLAAAVTSLGGADVFMAHILGNMLAAQAMELHPLQLQQVEKLLALNAAIPAEAFDSSTHNTGWVNNPMMHDEWQMYGSWTWASRFYFWLDPSDWRRGLTWINLFESVAPKLYNFYSTGDEVMRLWTDTQVVRIGTGGGLGIHAWQKQERFKGRGGLHGTDDAGWGFERNGLGTKVYTVEEANGLSILQRVTAPAFKREPPQLFDPNYWPAFMTRQILANGIPALSPPIGATSVNTGFNNRNFDMNINFDRSNGWPQSRDDNDWLHSDIKNVAYFYTHKLFIKLVDEGGLE